MTTVCIVGDPESIKGSGKTMTLTFLQYMDYCKGRRVLTNVEYSFPHEQLNMIEMVDDLENGKREKYQNISIGLDEFHLFMPSGGITKQGGGKELLINFLYQTRKLEIDVYYVTHRAMNVNNKIRGMVELMLMARKFHTDDNTHCVYDNCKREHIIEIRNVNDTQSFISKTPVYINPSVIGKLYPTMQLLDINVSKYWGETENHKNTRSKQTLAERYASWKFGNKNVELDKDEEIDEDSANETKIKPFVKQKTNLELIELSEMQSDKDLEEITKLMEEYKELSKGIENEDEKQLHQKDGEEIPLKKENKKAKEEMVKFTKKSKK